MKRIQKYFSKHVTLNSLTHAVGGVGIGIALTHPVFDPHPMRWAAAFIVLSLLGHLYAYKTKS